MLINISGPSGAGKDTSFTVAKEYLATKGIEAVKVSFVRPFKGVLENIYGLYEGELDTPEGKAKIVPGMSLTFLDVLIMAWSDSQNTIFSTLWSTIALEKIKDHLSKGRWVFLTDLRSDYERDALLTLPTDTPFDSLIIRGRGKVLSSDINSEALNKQLMLHFTGFDYGLLVENTGTTQDLKRHVILSVNHLLKMSRS